MLPPVPSSVNCQSTAKVWVCQLSVIKELADEQQQNESCCEQVIRVIVACALRYLFAPIISGCRPSDTNSATETLENPRLQERSMPSPESSLRASIMVKPTAISSLKTFSSMAPTSQLKGQILFFSLIVASGTRWNLRVCLFSSRMV